MVSNEANLVEQNNIASNEVNVVERNNAMSNLYSGRNNDPLPLNPNVAVFNAGMDAHTNFPSNATHDAESNSVQNLRHMSVGVSSTNLPGHNRNSLDGHGQSNPQAGHGHPPEAISSRNLNNSRAFFQRNSTLKDELSRAKIPAFNLNINYEPVNCK